MICPFTMASFSGKNLVWCKCDTETRCFYLPKSPNPANIHFARWESVGCSLATRYCSNDEMIREGCRRRKRKAISLRKSMNVGLDEPCISSLILGILWLHDCNICAVTVANSVPQTSFSPGLCWDPPLPWLKIPASELLANFGYSTSGLSSYPVDAAAGWTQVLVLSFICLPAGHVTLRHTVPQVVMLQKSEQKKFQRNLKGSINLHSSGCGADYSVCDFSSFWVSVELVAGWAHH